MSDVMRPESMVKKGAPLRGRASKPTVIVISGEDNVKVASSSSTVRVGRQVVFKIEPNVPVPPKQKQLLLLPNRIASISHNKKLVKVSSRLKAQDGGWLIKSQKILLLVLSIYLNQFGQFTGDQNWIKAATAQHRLAAGHKQQQQHETRAEQLISYVEPHQGDQVRSLRSAELVARSIGGQQGNGGALKPLNDNQLQPGELANRCSGHLDDRAAYGQAQNFEPLNKEQEEILRSIRIYYNLNDTQSVAYTIGQSNQERQQQQLQQPTKDKIGNGADTARPANELAVKRLPPLPRPSNLSVLIISWYPPILKLSWNLDEFEGQSGGGGSFGPHERHQRPGQPPWDQQQKEWRGKDNSINNNNALETNGTPSTTTTRAKATKTSLPRSNDNNDDNRSAAANAFVGTENEPGGFGGAGFDLELALEQADKEPSNENGSLAKHLRELKLRRFLVNKSLTCFQVTYNVVNSRFKVIEEYPPYLRSVLLERLLPATEYSLRVSAIYLNGRFRATSQRVQFISPTDNESRRFKENTYRPIHSYPDEQREVQIGLAQVRGEELTLVGIAVFFWIATICLFFNKWGKIRMLEPYQPAYREQLDVGSVTVGPTTPQMQLGSTGDGSGSPGGHTIAGAGLIGPSGAPGQMYAAATALSPSSSSYNLQQHQHHQLLASAAAAATVPQSSQDSAPPPPPTGSSSPTLPTAGATMTSSLDKATTAGPIVDKLGSSKHRTSENGGAALAATATVTGELATRKASMVLAGSGKRFGQPATIDYPLDVQARLVGSGAVSSSSKQPLLGRRAIGGTGTTSQLNYLFQSKAQALAKASLMWPTLSQPATLGASSGGVGSVGGPSVGGTGVIGAASLGQKFKQEQYRTKFGSSVTNATTELETLRRLGECLAARRHLSRMGATGGGGNPPANYSLTSQLIGAGGPFERLSKHASCDSNEQQHKHSLGHYQQPHQHHYHPMHHYGQPQQQQPHLKTGSAWKVLENFKENRPLFAGNRSQQQQKPGPGSGVHSFESAQGQEDVFSKLTAELGRSGKTGASSLSPQSSRILRPSRTESQSPTDGSQEPLQPVSSSTTTLGWSQVASAGNPGLQQQQQQHQHQKQQHQQQRRSVSSGSSAKSHLLSRFIRRNPAIDQTTNLSQRDSLRTATQSLDQSTSDSLASAQNSQRFETSSQQAAGTSIDQEQGGRDLPFQRLRRLQFVSKLHQHHHIAQSVSTSTLTKQSYYQQQNQQQQHSSQHTFESSSKANSLSLDSRELHHQPPPQVQLVAPADDGDVDEQQQQQRKQQQQQPSRRIGSKPSSLDLATQQQQQQQESGTLIEHHILIEPPSPPNIKQTMNLQDERDGEDDEPEERSKVSGADGTDDQQPVATAADSNAGGCGSVRSADESSQIRPSVSAFALLDSRQAAGLQQKPQQQDHDVRGRDEGLTEAETANTFRPTDSDSRIDIGETQTTQVAQTQHYHQPEICLDDSLLSGGDDASECRSEPVIRPISPAAASDIVVLEAPPLGTSGRRTSSSGREDAFKKLASTYRASTERRLSRLACARSSGQLSSVANWGGGQYCAQSWSAMGLCQAANMLESGRGAGDLSGGDHQAPSCSSSGGGATTTTATASGSTGRPPIRLYSICSASGLGQQQDDYLLRPDQAGGQASSTTMVPSPSRASLSVHVGHHSQQQQQPPHQHHHRQQQQQQQQQPTKRVRRCSFCNSIECANQQAALAIHQIRAIQLQQQQQQQQQQQRQKLAASHQGFWSAGSQQQPAIVSSDSEETTTTGRLDWPRAPLQPTVDHDDMDELDDGRHSMAGGGGPPISSSSTSRSRVSSVFAGSPYARSHRRDSFVMLRALSQKKSKSAEDIAYLSSLVLQIWTREPNPLLQNVSQLQAARSSELQAAAAASHGGTSDAEHHHQQQYQRSRRRSSSNLQAQSSAGGGGRLPDSDQRRQSAGPGGPSGGSADDDLAGARPQASTGQARRKRPKSSLTVAADY